MKVMVIVKANEQSEAGVLPDTEILTKMNKYNQELMNAGLLLAADGLQPSSKGKRVKFSGEQRIVTDGPFPETKELSAGFWIWKVKSIDKAVDWLNPAPCVLGVEIQTHPIHNRETFVPNHTARAL